MGIPSKLAKFGVPDLSGQADETLPPIPRSVMDRFPDLEGYEADRKRRWEGFVTLVRRQVDELGRAVSRLDDSVRENGTDIDTSESSIATLQSQVAELQETVEGLGSASASLAPINAAIDSLNALLAAHAASTTTHGVTGSIVGTTDAQDLDSKRIGTSKPKEGRFMALMTKDSIDPTEDIIVPSGYTMLVFGNLSVAGRLRIEGRLRVL